jgi:hypothetical protein
MESALFEMLNRMTVRDLQRAVAASERHGDRELTDLLSAHLVTVAPPSRLGVGPEGVATG